MSLLIWYSTTYQLLLPPTQYYQKCNCFLQSGKSWLNQLDGHAVDAISFTLRPFCLLAHMIFHVSLTYKSNFDYPRPVNGENLQSHKFIYIIQFTNKQHKRCGDYNYLIWYIYKVLVLVSYYMLPKYISHALNESRSKT